MRMRRVSRRRFLKGTGTALTVAAVAPSLRAEQPPTGLARQSAERATAARTAIALTVNGKPQRLEVEDHWTLVEALRDTSG
jgi:hypothetical protein